MCADPMACSTNCDKSASQLFIAATAAPQFPCHHGLCGSEIVNRYYDTEARIKMAWRLT